MTASILLLLAGLATAEAKTLVSVPSHYVKVSIQAPPDAPGQIKRSLAYLDGPALLLRGNWIDPTQLEDVPDPRSPVPELLAPVRLAIPDSYKLVDLESRDSVLGEVRAESFTTEARIYRVYLPITGMKTTHRYEVVFHAGLKVPITLVASFEPPEGLVVRNQECVRQGVALDWAVQGFQEKTEPNLIYLFCRVDGSAVHVGVYAPLDRQWTKYGYGARKVFAGRGLYFDLPRPPRGVMVPETATEFGLDAHTGKTLLYELRYDPPYRPRLFTASLGLGPAYHHYSEDRAGFSIDELSFFGKFWLQAKTPLPGLDVYGDIYGTIQDITHSPSTTPPVDQALPAINYWAMNFRLGYVEPVTPIEPEWSLMTGWYWWKFEIVNDRYGLANKLAGPQVFVQYRHQGLGKTPWQLSARWVFLSNAGLPGGISDYEASVGAGVDIAWVGRRRPLTLNFEATRLQFFQADKQMALHNLVLFLSYPLY